MTLSITQTGRLLAAAIMATCLFVPATFAAEDEGQRKPPEARTSGTLGPQVMRAISEIQEMMSPEDESDTPDMEGAKEALG
jgi:hypothetical protein